MQNWSEVIPGRVLPAQRRPVIGLLDGEGSGPEVVAVCRRILDTFADTFEVRCGGAIGSAAEKQHGTPLTDDCEVFCRDVFASGGAILHGAGGGRFVYELRRRFDLFCKISPLRPAPELCHASRFTPEHVTGLDLIIIRENSAGVYQGQWRETQTAGERIAEHSFSYSDREVRRILEVAARIAGQRRGELAVVIKDGGVPAISKLWRDCAFELTGIKTRLINVDHAAYELIQNPRHFDVIVTPNLFGDILVDASAVLLGSRGLSFSGNFSATAAVYQTNHGAAHDLAGKNLANPVGQIFALAMLLRESFGRHADSDRIERAVREVWRQGWRTADLNEPGCRLAGTREFGELVVAALT